MTLTLAVRRPRRRLRTASWRSCRLYKDPRQPVDRRVDDLLARMTLEEKVAQLETIWEQKAKVQTADGHFSPSAARRPFPNGIGGFARPSDKRGVTAVERRRGRTGATVNRDARDTAEYVNAAQHWAVEHTRLGIPILMHEESLHGYVARGATSFPQAIALASTWDPELGQPGLLGRCARDARPRRVPRAGAGRRRRPRSALGPDRGDLWRGPLSGRRRSASRRSAASRARRCRLAPDKVLRDAEAFHRPRPARERHQRRARRISASASCATISSRRSKRAVKTYPIRSVMASYNEIDGIPSPRQQLAAERRAARRMGLPGRGRQRLLRHPRADDPAQAVRQHRATPPSARSSRASTSRRPIPRAMSHLPELVRERPRAAGAGRRGGAPRAAR